MKKLQIIFYFLFLTVNSFAQKTLVYLDAERSYKTGTELFNKEKFGAAQEEFSKIIQSKTGISEEVKTNSEYYYALCAMELFNKDAEFLLTEFVKYHPESPKAGVVNFQLGKFYYKQKRYKYATEWFEKVDVYYLNDEERSEYYFKFGYSYFNINQQEKASKAFYEIKDVDTKYTPASNYYYAHIAYQNKNYETALQGFQKLKNTEGFSTLVPYYISQIYFLQEKYSSLIEYATPLLTQGNPQNSMEITRMIGESYYRQLKYNEAIPYLEEYQKNASNISRDEIYELGYALYKTNHYERAIDKFEKYGTIGTGLTTVSSFDDALAQNTYYLMADCFLKVNKKQNARNAFQLAGKMDYDKDIKEDAFFSYAKLTYELSIQSAAVNAFQQYIKLFPTSPRVDRANEFLAEIFLTTKNYKDALTAIDSIKTRTEKIKSAYQKAAYYRGTELLNDGKQKDAIELFNKSLANPLDAKLVGLSHYWKGEALFRSNDYDVAIKSYNDFLFIPAAVNLPIYNLANYNLGYSYFKKENYNDASTWFRKYIKNKSETDAARYNDATLRIADGFMIQHDYFNAADYYDEAIKNKAVASDYAFFQRGMIYGIQNKLKEKISALENIAAKYPKSPYFDDALYETGNAKFLLDQTETAFTTYQQLVGQFPTSSYVKKALLGIALIYFNQKDDSMALMTYKKIVADYPATPEAKAALVGIKNVCINQSKADEYFAYAKTISFANIDKASQDSVTYEAAEVRYMKGDCENAAKDFGNYLDKFSDGAFALHANFYKAECEYKTKQFDKALIEYNFVMSKPKNIFTETSLLKTAAIYYSLAKYDSALKNYSILEQIAEYKNNITEAVIGKMRCNFLLNKYLSAIELAQKVFALDKVSNEIINEAHLTTAKSALAIDSISLALSEFSIIAKSNSEFGAEAKYNVALIHFKQANYKESQKTIFDLINQIPSYDNWIAKGFILLSDNYMQQNDAFQAKTTLQSILDNYGGADTTVKSAAQGKLKTILEKEKAQNELEMKEKLIANPDSTNGGIERE